MAFPLSRKNIWLLAPALAVISACSESVTLDTTPPRIAFTTPREAVTEADSIVLEGMVSDDGGITALSFSVDGGASTPVAIDPGNTIAFREVVRTLTAGVHTASFVATDRSGNSAAHELTFRYAPPLGSITVAVSISGNDPDAAVLVRADSGSWRFVRRGDGPLRIDSLLLGDRTLEVTHVASNCEVTGGMHRAVQVTRAGVATAIQVVCAPAARAATYIRELTTGYRVIQTNLEDRGAVLRESVDSGARSVAWSPDGRMLAYQGTLNGVTGIFVANSDWSEIRPVTSLPANSHYPSWSPDGSKLAVQVGIYPSAIWVVDVEANTSRRLMDGANWPRWSPDGLEIAVVQGRSLAVISPEGGAPRTIYSGPSIIAAAPAWAPDGRRIAFGRINEDGLLVVKRDGSEPVVWSCRCAAEDPDWSQDGALIVFRGFEAGHPALWVMNGDGTGLRRFSPIGFSGWNTSFRP